MKRFAPAWVLAALLTSACPGTEPLAPVPGPPQPYYLVFLRPDPSRAKIPQAERERIMAAHMANISRLAADGILAAAGPMDDPAPTISGVFVLRAPSLEEARRVALLDPTVAEHRNTVDVHAWRGPRGIGDTYFASKKAAHGTKDTMAAHAFCILLRRGPVPPHGDPEHEAFVDSLRSSGALVAAGTTDGDPAIAGILIFRSGSTSQARLSLGSDPAVAYGRLTPELHVWWTADGVMPW
jgi:uncharacterized protein YciI